MIEVNEAKLLTIRRDDRTISSASELEIITDSETYCPSIIGLKNIEEIGLGKCGYNCKDCWDKALAEVDDFKILWKYKGSDEYV